MLLFSVTFVLLLHHGIVGCGWSLLVGNVKNVCHFVVISVRNALLFYVALNEPTTDSKNIPISSAR